MKPHVSFWKKDYAKFVYALSLVEQEIDRVKMNPLIKKDIKIQFAQVHTLLKKGLVKDEHKTDSQ